MFVPETRATTLPPYDTAVVGCIKNESNIYLRAITPSSTDEGAYIPPQEMYVYGLSAITALRDFLSSLLQRHAELTGRVPLSPGPTVPNPSQPLPTTPNSGPI